MKTISNLFLILAVLLSDVMCAVVAYNYCDMMWGIKYAGYSAPVSTAFLVAIPFCNCYCGMRCNCAVFQKENS